MPDANDILAGNSQDQSLAGASQQQASQPGVQQEPGGFFKKLLATILSGTAAGIEAGPSAFPAQGFSSGFNQANSDRQQFMQQQAQQKQQQFQNSLASNREARDQQAFQTNEQLKHVQLANSQLEMQRTSMMLNQMREDLRHPLQKATADATADFIKKGAGEIVAQGEDLPTAQQHIMELQKANPNEALHYFAAPSEVGDDGQPKSYAVIKMRPSGSMPSDGSYDIPGNEDLGIAPVKIDYKEGEDTRSLMSRYTHAMEDQTKKIAIAQHSQDTHAQIQGAGERTTATNASKERIAAMQGQVKLQEQHMRSAGAAGDKEAIALDKQISDLTKSRATLAAKRKGYVFDKNETQEEKDIDNQIGNLTQQLNDHMKSAKYPQEGQQVTLKDGRTVTIKHINPDGTFNY